MHKYLYFFHAIMQEQRWITHYSDIFKWIQNPDFLCLYQKLIPFFESLNLKNKKSILAVSWWADSMLMAITLLLFANERQLDLQNIHIAHCNHKIRLESENEAKAMSDFFIGLNFHLFERTENWWTDENHLRNRRYEQFSTLQEIIEADYVFLGHHLNDRVESTILHLMRGSGMNGFLNMHQIQVHPLLSNECKACRPLLSISKNNILDVCNKIWLPYFEDKTNQDSDISKRNRVRNEIMIPLCGYGEKEWNHFLTSFANIYNELEIYENSKESCLNKPILREIPKFPLWKADFSYKYIKNILNCNSDDIIYLWKELWIKIQISSTLVSERRYWLNDGKNSYKKLSNVYFFIHEKELFIIKAESNFWERKWINTEDEKLEIKDLNSINFFGFDLTIPREELIWSIVRLPKRNDIFGWKSRHRWALNQKIPMWRRDWIPLAIKDGKVIHMWKSIRR